MFLFSFIYHLSLSLQDIQRGPLVPVFMFVNYNKATAIATLIHTYKEIRTNWILPSRTVSLPQCRASGAHGIIHYLNSIGIDRQFRILHKSNAHANIAQERPLLKLGNLVSVLQCFRCDPLTPCDAAIC